MTLGALVVALAGGCAGNQSATPGTGPGTGDIRLIGQEQYGGDEAAGYHIAPTAESLPPGRGEVAIAPDEKVVVIHGGTHADGRYSMRVSAERVRGSIQLTCRITVADAGSGTAFTQAIVRPWRAYAVPAAASVVVDGCERAITD